MLSQQLRRLKRCQTLDEIVVATTVNDDDDPVVRLADSEGVRWFRGSEHDVLERYALAAAEAEADVVTRLTADCPLIDPEQTDAVVNRLTLGSVTYDYCSNVVRRTLPRGLDSEALWRDCLDRVHRVAQSREAREHVTWFILRERPDLFQMGSVEDPEDNSDLSWTVDTAEDLERVRLIYSRRGLGEGFLDYRETLRQVRGSMQ